MISDANKTSAAVVQTRAAMSEDTFSRSAIEIPKSPWKTPLSHSQ